MKTENTRTPLQKSILRIALGTAGILLIPLIAMQFSDDVDWNIADFIVIGTLLFSSGLLYVLITKNMKNKDNRLIIGILFGLAVLWIWAELAVGVFTNWGS